MVMVRSIDTTCNDLLLGFDVLDCVEIISLVLTLTIYLQNPLLDWACEGDQRR